MKKVTIFVALLLISSVTFSQNLDSLFDNIGRENLRLLGEFKEEKETIYITNFKKGIYNVEYFIEKDNSTQYLYKVNDNFNTELEGIGTETNNNSYEILKFININDNKESKEIKILKSYETNSW